MRPACVIWAYWRELLAIEEDAELMTVVYLKTEDKYHEEKS